VWEHAAAQLHSYRINAGITDPEKTGLGQIPPKLIRLLVDARKQLSVPRPERGRQQDTGLEI
jgi:hypothetical protein